MGFCFMTLGEYLNQNKETVTQIRSCLPEFGNDLYSFCKHIKQKFGFWVNAFYSEDGSIKLSFQIEQEVHIPVDQKEYCTQLSG